MTKSDLVSLIETLHTTLCLIFLYWYLVTQFGDVLNGLDRIHWSVQYIIFIVHRLLIEDVCSAIGVSKSV